LVGRLAHTLSPGAVLGQVCRYNRKAVLPLVGGLCDAIPIAGL
jgi:hypothetical protein